MRLFRVSLILLSGCVAALMAQAQAVGTRPVLSATPAQTAPPAGVPATSTQPAGGSAAPISGVSGVLPTPSGASQTGQTVAPGAAPDASAGAADTLPNYVIGPDDNIAISVWKEPGLSGTLPVRPDGMISLSLVGDIQASGYTPTQLAADIAIRLKKFVNDPSVTVSVLGVNSKRIFLLGEVGHVGPMPLTAGLTPLQALVTAGGVSAFANSKHIYILRTVAGKQQKIPFNYKKAVKDGDQQGVVLQAGDTIVVP